MRLPASRIHSADLTADLDAALIQPEVSADKTNRYVAEVVN
jgi:hypothetical protein